MKEVYEDIKEAIMFLNKEKNSGHSFNKYSTSFLFTTENQEGLSKILDYKDKNVWSVAASGDQYLASIYYGARKVDLFDINRFAYYITYLKIGAIMTLDYNEFLNFFVPVHNYNIEKSFWDYDILLKVLKVLPADVALFWKEVIFYITNMGKQYGNFVAPNNFYNSLMSVVRGMPFYNMRNEYLILKSKLLKMEFPSFKEVDIANIKSEIDVKYDILYLSNIIECMVRNELERSYFMNLSLEDEIEKEKYKLVMEQVRHLLNKKGQILLGYRTNTRIEEATDFLYHNDDLEVRAISSKVLPYDELGFEASDVDLVLTYKMR